MPPKSHQDAKKLAKTHIGLVEHDSFLLPYEEEIGRPMSGKSWKK